MDHNRTQQKQANEKPGIQVICAGSGRTGTLSLTEALSILGHTPYHFVDFNHAKQWADFSRCRQENPSSPSDVIIDTIVKDGYTAVLENPTCDIYQEILDRYPDAKVVLTVRDSPEKFEQSWKTLFDTMIITEQGFRWSFPSFFGWIPLFCHLKAIRPFMGTTHLGLPRGALTHGWRQQPTGWLGQQYVKHNQHVQQHVPAKQLLVFNVKEGWKPLCDFLGCEVPTVPFPHSKVNDSKALTEMRRHFVVAVYSWIPLLVVSLGSAALWAHNRESNHLPFGGRRKG